MEMEQVMEMLKAMQAKADADRKAYQEKVEAENKAWLEKIEAETKAIRAETKAMRDKRMNANIKIDREETTACHAEMDTEKIEPDSGMMQSAEEHLEIPMEDAAVMPVGGRKKRRRARKPAAGRRGEPNELTRGDCLSGKKLAAACRVSRRATVAWRKRIGTQIICGPRSKLTAAKIKVTHHARVTWPRVKFVRKECTRDQTEQETAKGRKDGGLWNGPKCNSDIKNHRTRQQLRLGNEKTTSMIYRKAIRLEIVKRTLRISSVFRKTRKWTLWRGRPPPKRKKR
jgi:hypothetical protein